MEGEDRFVYAIDEDLYRGEGMNFSGAKLKLTRRSTRGDEEGN